MKRVIILGASGSIGQNALRVISERRGEFKVVGLAVGSDRRALAAQARRYAPRAVALAGGTDAGWRGEFARRGIKAYGGAEGICRLVRETKADMCLVAIGGAAALAPTVAAIQQGLDIALASKEVLVMAGDLVMALARRRGVKILPVDSEHSAVFQCLAGVAPGEIARLWLTASGGPFFGYPRRRLRRVTARQALRHPTWRMGAKITVDSATMMNKGLEVIEAHHLFDLPPDKIKVVIHPQSVVHSMVELIDGSVKAQLSTPDMRLPIQYALTFPRRRPRPAPRLDWARALKLEFLPLAPREFPCLRLAYRALAAGGTAPAILNAANEEAVDAFLRGRLGFLGIAGVVAGTMRATVVRRAGDWQDIQRADEEARRRARQLIAARGRQ